MSGFHCTRLSKLFKLHERTLAALEDINFEVKSGAFVCIVGPSGCGKTTLLRLVAGLLEPTSGAVTFDNATAERPRCAMVFQDHGLFPWMTVADNVAFGLEARGMARSERRALAQTQLERVHLAGFASSYPHQLSGGMRQRVGVARAFLADPHILLMDEPFGALDAQTRLILQEELLSIWKEQQTTVLYVTHDIDEAILLGDRVIVLSGRPGHVVADITVPLSRPRNLLAGEGPEAREIKTRIWRLIEAEARRHL